MAPSIRPVWEERLVCRRCGEEYTAVAGAIPGYVGERREAGGSPGSGDPKLGSEPIPSFSVFDGETPVCLDCGGLLSGRRALNPQEATARSGGWRYRGCGGKTSDRRGGTEMCVIPPILLR